LRKVKNRTQQMLNTIGVSEGILKMIEKRSKTDMVLFVVMAIITLIVIYLLVAYVKPILSPQTLVSVVASNKEVNGSEI
jgi:predicted membrane channel-forming protein YqfA (hemolysin III family)